MLLKQDTRDFYHLDMYIKFKPDYLDDQYLDLKTLVPAVKAARGSSVSYEKGKVEIFLQDVSDEGDSIILLVRIDGTGFADATFGQRGGVQVRREGPRSYERRCYSAHLIFRQQDGNNPYEVLLERISGLGPSAIKKYLNQILRDVKVTMERDGTPPRKVHPLIELYPHASDTLGAAILRGIAKQVRVTYPERVMDSEVRLRESRVEVIRFGRVGEPLKLQVLQDILSIFRGAQAARADDMRVVLEDDGQQYTVQVELDKDLENSPFYKRHRVTLGDDAEPLAETSDKVRPDLVRAAIEQVDAGQGG